MLNKEIWINQFDNVYHEQSCYNHFNKWDTFEEMSAILEDTAEEITACFRKMMKLKKETKYIDDKMKFNLCSIGDQGETWYIYQEWRKDNIYKYYVLKYIRIDKSRNLYLASTIFRDKEKSISRHVSDNTDQCACGRPKKEPMHKLFWQISWQFLLFIIEAGNSGIVCSTIEGKQRPSYSQVSNKAIFEELSIS